MPHEFTVDKKKHQQWRQLCYSGAFILKCWGVQDNTYFCQLENILKWTVFFVGNFILTKFQAPRPQDNAFIYNWKDSTLMEKKHLLQVPRARNDFTHVRYLINWALSWYLFFQNKAYKHIEPENVIKIKHNLSISLAWEKR